MSDKERADKLMKYQGQEFGTFQIIERFRELEARIYNLEQSVDYLIGEDRDRTDRPIG